MFSRPGQFGGSDHLHPGLEKDSFAAMITTIETTDPEREAWLKLSENSLMKFWGNDGDDIFNALLKT